MSLLNSARAGIVVLLTAEMRPALKLHGGRKRLRGGVKGEHWVFEYVRLGGVGTLGPPERAGFVRQGMSLFVEGRAVSVWGRGQMSELAL